MSSPSITLKCGSVNSFFIAAFLTLASTPGATKREKSDSRVSSATSASVGSAGTCSALGVSASGSSGSGAALGTTGGVLAVVLTGIFTGASRGGTSPCFTCALR